MIATAAMFWSLYKSIYDMQDYITRYYLLSCCLRFKWLWYSNNLLCLLLQVDNMGRNLLPIDYKINIKKLSISMGFTMLYMILLIFLNKAFKKIKQFVSTHIFLGLSFGTM